MILRMAFRNMIRNRRRSFLASVSVCIAVAGILVHRGLIEGFMDNIVRNTTRSDTGHVKIASADYLENAEYMPVHHIIHNPDELIRLISGIPEVADKLEIVAERFRFPILVEFRGNNKAVICFAGDIEVERRLTMLHRAIVEGRYLEGKIIEENGTRYREVIIGREAAESLGIRVGDSFSLMVQGSDLGIRIPRFKVVGIFETGMRAFDDSVFMISTKDAKEILGTGGGVQEIILMLKDYNDGAQVASKINEALRSTEEFSYVRAVDWRNMIGVTRMFSQAMVVYNIIYLVVLLLGSLIIMSIMTMVILERRREIGILRAMGFRKREVVLLFTLEGTMLGLAGTSAGVLLGLLINAPLSIWGVEFTFSSYNFGFFIDSVVRWKITADGVLIVAVISVLVSSVVSVVPSMRAASMRPVDAIRST